MSGLTAEEAAGRLGVKVATLYAYVSRGVLRRWNEPGSRLSLFDPEEVEALARRGRPRRASPPLALDLVVRTSLTVIGDRDFRYRGVSALGLARTASFEEVANWLWTGQRSSEHRPWPATPLPLPEVGSARDRLRLAVVLMSASDPLRADLSAPAVVDRGCRLIAAMAGAVSSHGGVAGEPLCLPAGGPALPGTVAGRLWHGLGGTPPNQRLVAALNAALVLLADHELAASTLAARVAASARADPYAVVLAGLGPMSGALHGGASRLARELLEAAAATGPEPALARATETHGHPPGFGHRLYPAGDPRARLLLEMTRAAAPRHLFTRVADRLIETARQRAGVEPNVDFALALLTMVARMPPEAGEIVFTVARTAGWLAHALEEYGEPPLRFRARAVARALR